MRVVRWLVVLAMVLLLAGGAVPAAADPAPPPPSPPTTPPPPPGGCTETDAIGNCIIRQPVVTPGTPASEGPVSDPIGSGGGGDGGDPGHAPTCPWTTVPETAALRSMHPEAPEGAIWQVASCGDVATGAGVRWLPPGPAAPTPPAASAVASILYATAKAQMVAPAVATDPPADVAGVVNTPVFVEVTNWQSEIVESECVLGVCVSLTASPSLVFDPGDGSAPVACEPPGSRYVPGGEPMEVQAEGACAHVYRLRTGAEGRPSAWPGLVSVTWDVLWTSNVAGASGSFDPLVFSTAVPRAVDEVLAVVVDGSS